jgi:hypothetical protein
MIRSGLVNNRKGGGFQDGYPHQRDNTPRDEIVRPYVDGIDTGMGARSDLKQIVPKPVSYNQIFGKTTTPDERLYLLKMVQKGMVTAPETKTGRPTVSAPPLPTRVESTDESSTVVEEDTMPNLMMESDVEEDEEVQEDMLQGDMLLDEMRAQDVVEPVIHQNTLDEDMLANETWTQNVDWEVTPVVLPHKHSGEDDVDVVLTENNFGGGLEISTVEPSLEIVPEIKNDIVSQEIRINGIGPRRNTDSNRLKAIQQKARSEMFSQSRTIGPMREQVSRWKSTDERMEEKGKKKKKSDKKARAENLMRGRDYGKLGAPSTQMLEEPVQPVAQPVAPKKIEPKKSKKDVPKRKPVGVRKSERVTSQRTVKINNLKLIILKLTKKEEALKKQGKKLSNNQFKVLFHAEKDLKKLLE